VAVTYCPDLSGSAQAAASGAAIIAPMSYLSVPMLMSQPTGVGTQQPIFPYVPRTLDLDYDASSGQLTRHVCGLFQYEDGYGNATLSTVKTYAGYALSTEVAAKTTHNTYLNDAINWRLGRLTTSVIDDTRAGVTKSRDPGRDSGLARVPRRPRP
jgi:hypothetical protein